MAGIRIAFVGKPAAGQASAANYLKTKRGFKRVRFIDAVTRICRLLYFPHKYERIDWEKRRAIYDALYKIDPNVFINWIKFKMSLSTWDIVIDDAKYINEVQGLKELGFTIIRINSSTKHRAMSIGRYLGKNILPGTVTLTEFFNKDASEILQVDYSIYHDGNLKNLGATLDELLTKFDTDGKLQP